MSIFKGLPSFTTLFPGVFGPPVLPDEIPAYIRRQDGYSWHYDPEKDTYRNKGDRQRLSSWFVKELLYDPEVYDPEYVLSTQRVKRGTPIKPLPLAA